jgi:nucleoid-associated protein YgaU
MAALPIGSLPARRRPALRLVVGGDVAAAPAAPSSPPPAPVASRTVRRGAARARRFVPGLLTLGLLAGLWWGAGALTGLRPAAAAGQRAPGAALVAGQSYVVRPGDTLWSIALRLDPAGDPRPVVDQLESELGSATLQPGEVLQLP